MNTTAETKRPTDWRGWKITDEQADAISNGDADARNRFYLDNLDRIRNMATNYAARNPRYNYLGAVDDLAQSLYLDMTLWTHRRGNPITSGGAISNLVYRSFFYAQYGGIVYCLEHCSKRLHGDYMPTMLSLDAPCGSTNSRKQDEDGGTLLDILADAMPAPDALDAVPDLSDECKAIAAPYLTTQQRAFFDCRLDGIVPTFACEHIGIKQQGGLTQKIHFALVKNYAAIVDELELLGVTIPPWAKNRPDDYERATQPPRKLSDEKRAERAAKVRAARKEGKYKDTPEQRAKRNAYKRAQRAAKKAAALAAVLSAAQVAANA